MKSREDYLAKFNMEGSRGVWFTNRKKLDFILRKYRSFFKRGMSHLDIGIGDGYTMKECIKMGLDVSGLDISAYLVNYHQKSFKEEGLKADIRSASASEKLFDNGSFDIVTAFDVLEHIPGDKMFETLDNIALMLKQGGVLIATLPFNENLDTGMAKCPKCSHVFHKVGHYHSFPSFSYIADILDKNFIIVSHGFLIKFRYRFDLLNKAYNYLRDIKKRVFSTNRDGETIYLVAQVKK